MGVVILRNKNVSGWIHLSTSLSSLVDFLSSLRCVLLTMRAIVFIKEYKTIETKRRCVCVRGGGVSFSRKIFIRLVP